MNFMTFTVSFTSAHSCSASGGRSSCMSDQRSADERFWLFFKLKPIKEPSLCVLRRAALSCTMLEDNPEITSHSSLKIFFFFFLLNGSRLRLTKPPNVGSVQTSRGTRIDNGRRGLFSGSLTGSDGCKNRKVTWLDAN